jgi:hypothetical protein
MVNHSPFGVSMSKLLESFYARGAAPWATSVKIIEDHGSISLSIKTGNTESIHWMTRATVEALADALFRSVSEARVRDGDVTFYHRAGKAVLPEAEGAVCGTDDEGCS